MATAKKPGLTTVTIPVVPPQDWRQVSDTDNEESERRSEATPVDNTIEELLNGIGNTITE